MAIGDPCHWCGAPATHLCTGCGHWICDGTVCALKSVRDAAKQLILGGYKNGPDTTN
jgi:hypothetical protein